MGRTCVASLADRSTALGLAPPNKVARTDTSTSIATDSTARGDCRPGYIRPFAINQYNFVEADLYEISEAKGRGVRARAFINKGEAVGAYPGGILARVPYLGPLDPDRASGALTAHRESLRRVALPTTRYTFSHPVSNQYIAEWNAHCHALHYIEPADNPAPDDPSSQAGIIYMLDCLCDYGIVQQLTDELASFPFSEKSVDKVRTVCAQLDRLASGKPATLPTFAFRLHGDELQRRLPDDAWCTIHPKKVCATEVLESLYYGWMKYIRLPTAYPYFGGFINEADEPSAANVEFSCEPAKVMAQSRWRDSKTGRRWAHPVPFIVATRDIEPGEELLAEYNDTA